MAFLYLKLYRIPYIFFSRVKNLYLQNRWQNLQAEYLIKYDTVISKTEEMVLDEPPASSSVQHCPLRLSN